MHFIDFIEESSCKKICMFIVILLVFIYIYICCVYVTFNILDIHVKLVFIHFCKTKQFNIQLK